MERATAGWLLVLLGESWWMICRFLVAVGRRDEEREEGWSTRNGVATEKRQPTC